MTQGGVRPPYVLRRTRRRWPSAGRPEGRAPASCGVRGGGGRSAGRPARRRLRPAAYAAGGGRTQDVQASRPCVLRRTRRRWPVCRTSAAPGACVLRRTRRRWPSQDVPRGRAPASCGVRGGGDRSAGRPVPDGRLRHAVVTRREVPLRMTQGPPRTGRRTDSSTPWTSTQVRQSGRSVHSVFASSTAAFAAQNCRRWRIGSLHDPDSTHQQQRPRAAGRRAARNPPRHPHHRRSCRRELVDRHPTGRPAARLAVRRRRTARPPHRTALLTDQDGRPRKVSGWLADVQHTTPSAAGSQLRTARLLRSTCRWSPPPSWTASSPRRRPPS